MPKAEDMLHTAICQAVGILNTAPDVARIAEGRQVSNILRQALADYAEALMNEPAKPVEIERMRRGHKRGAAGVAPNEGGGDGR